MEQPLDRAEHFLSRSRNNSVRNLAQLSLVNQQTQPKSFASLPPEIVSKILEQLLVPAHPGEDRAVASRDLVRVLGTSLVFYDIGVPLLYSHVSFSHPHVFDKFRHSIVRYGYGRYVKVLDFSTFTSIGLGRTGRMNSEIQMLTSDTIMQVLDVCPNLQELLAAESVDSDVDFSVLRKALSMPRMVSLDLCGSTNLTALAMTRVAEMDWSRLENLSLHNCSTMSSSSISELLPRLTSIKRLDLSHTQTTTAALLNLPRDVRLTHLSLARCTNLDSDELYYFLTRHSALSQLTWLNLMCEPAKSVPLSGRNTHRVLASLPATVEYLNVHGLPIRAKDIEALAQATPSLQSLSVGAASLSILELQECLPRFGSLRYLELTGNPNISHWTLQDPVIVQQTFFGANPLQIVEFSSELVAKLQGTSTLEGVYTEIGRNRRGWLYRLDRFTSNSVRPSELDLELSVMPLAVVEEEDAPLSFFSALAKSKIREHELTSGIPRSAKRRHITEKVISVGPSVDRSPDWRWASRKINVDLDAESWLERGAYQYYGYHS